jgi:hypothetical protein
MALAFTDMVGSSYAVVGAVRVQPHDQNIPDRYGGPAML